MKYCKNCLQPDTRPNTKFNNDGVCPACIYFYKLPDVDWRERFQILQKILSKSTKRTNQQFDCIIGVSGGKDSTRQAIWARDKFGLRPLLACLSYPPEQVTQRGVDNIANLIDLGFDVVMSAPSPVTWKKLMRESFLQFTNWAKSTELALFSSVPQLAIRYEIPLILWGENPGLQLGDLKTLGKNGYDGNNLRNMNTLAGAGYDWMLDAGFKEKDLIPYNYPSLKEFKDNNIQIVYLGWFLGDWSLLNNGAISSMLGIKIRHDVAKNTGDLYAVSSLDEDWVTLNQMIKYYKYGFGRASDYVNEMIRLKIITREEGIKLVEKYDGACSKQYIDTFCEFIGISTKVFWDKVKSVTNKKLFEISGDTITRKFKVGHGDII